MTCITGRPSISKGAVLYIGDSHGRCHFYSHSKQGFYQDALLLFPNTARPNGKKISQVVLIKYSRDKFFLVATSGFLKKKIAMLNEFTNRLQHFRFVDKIVRIGVIKDYKAHERPPDSP